MRLAAASLALLLCVAEANAQAVVVASGAYPEGLLWHNGRMLFTELGADRVSIIEAGATREFWRGAGCGPTAIAPFGANAFLVNCHLGRELVEITAAGATTGRRFRVANGAPIQNPNASVGDGQGGVFFSDSGQFSSLAPPTGKVYHLSASGVMTEVIAQLRYANGVNFDPAARLLYVSEHLARRVLTLTLDRRHQVAARRVFADFSEHAATRQHSYPLGGPDGIALRPGYLAVAEYGEGRVHVFDRDGRHRVTLKVSMPFVDTVAWDGAGNLYAGGSFQNTRAPFEGAVVRFPQSEWQRAP